MLKDFASKMGTVNHRWLDGKAREEENLGRDRMFLQRVIDNDNFVSAASWTVLTSGLYLLHRELEVRTNGKKAGRSRLQRETTIETAGQVVGTMHRHRERGAHRVPPADSSFLPN